MQAVDFTQAQPYNNEMEIDPLSWIIKKLLTLWKGTINFLYVATHWGEISGGRDRDRQEVKFLDERLKSYKEYYKEDIERIRGETATLLAASQKSKEGWQQFQQYTMEMLVDTIFKIALKAHLNPSEWESEKAWYMPRVQELVESMRAKLPPQPRPDPFSSAGLFDPPLILPVGTLLAKGGKDKDKDPSKK